MYHNSYTAVAVLSYGRIMSGIKTCCGSFMKRFTSTYVESLECSEVIWKNIYIPMLGNFLLKTVWLTDSMFLWTLEYFKEKFLTFFFFRMFWIICNILSFRFFCRLKILIVFSYDIGTAKFWLFFFYNILQNSDLFFF